MAYIGQNDYWVERAVQNIKAEYGDTVSVEAKNKSLIKYGVNTDLDNGVRETIWTEGGDETYPTGNNIDIITSTEATDNQEVVIEGHTLSGSNLTFVTQTATLNGTADVTLSTPLYRANRMYNNGSTNFAGIITVEDNGTSTHLKCTGATNQSLKCATSLSSTDYWIVTALDVSVRRSTDASVDFELQVREYGKAWRTRYYITSNSFAGGQLIQLEPCITIPPNSDVRMVGTSNVNNTGASSSIHGVLASII